MDAAAIKTKLKTHVDQNRLKINGKLRKVVKLRKMLLVKLVNDYFSGILGEISDNFRKI